MQPVSTLLVTGATGDLLEWRLEPRDLAGIDGIVYLAARTHVMHESSADPLAAYRALNVGVAIRLAGSLEVDASSLRQALVWQPLVPSAVGLARMAGWYHAHTPTVNAD